MKKTIHVLFWTAWAIICLGVLPGAAQMSFVVSPIRVEHQVAAGASETNVIEVRNEGGKPARVKVYTEDWQMDRKGDVNYARAGKGPNSCATWIQLNPADFRVNPGQTRQVRYTVTVPPGAKEGGYRAAIIFEGMPAAAGGPGAPRMVAVHGRIGVVLYETVGKPEIKARFEDFQIRPEKHGLTFKLTLANKGAGNFRIKKSWVSLKNSQGQEVAKVEIPDVPVLPGAIRDLEFSKELTLPKGTYQAEAILDVGRRDFLGRRQSFTIGR
jgi:P pilus assembly chaperone PapD